jgi:hypothetical protein
MRIGHLERILRDVRLIASAVESVISEVGMTRRDCGMLARRVGLLVLCAASVAATMGVVAAHAVAPSTVLKFNDANGQTVGVGVNLNDQNAVPPVGSSIVTTLRLQNIGSQFGKPGGAFVGRVLLDCTVLAASASGAPDGTCSGIAHVPNGYFTFGGNGGFANSRVIYFDITGGVGPYANDRGQIRVVNKANGGSDATVSLYTG